MLVLMIVLSLLSAQMEYQTLCHVLAVFSLTKQMTPVDGSVPPQQLQQLQQQPQQQLQQLQQQQQQQTLSFQKIVFMKNVNMEQMDQSTIETSQPLVEATLSAISVSGVLTSASGV